MVRFYDGKMTVEKALDLLGDTPDQVAHTLKLAGITGVRDSSHCPVANWIRRLLPNLEEIGVASHARGYLVGRTWWGGTSRRYLSVLCPRSVQQFTIAFDHWLYPDLVTGWSACPAPSALAIGKHEWTEGVPVQP